MCSKFNYTHHVGCKCACVARLCPHNSISNVVVSVTIYDDKNIYIYIYIYILCIFYLYLYMYLCVYLSVYLCMCVCVFCVVCCVLLRAVVSCCVSWWRKFEKGNVRRNPGGEALLTCKSFGIFGERCDRPTEQSSSLFPSGQLKTNSFIR